MRNFKLSIGFLIAFALITSIGCNSIENLSNSSSKLSITSITNAANKIPIFSSVSLDINTIANISFKASLLNPTIKATEATIYNDIVIDRIDVRYTRTDGRNTPLTDVPLSFSIPVTYQISIGDTLTIPISIIRHNAKLEPPLRDLRELGQEQELVLVAHITVYSHDVAGNRLEPAIGWVNVHCSDFTAE